jgi:hypothetical protein
MYAVYDKRCMMKSPPGTVIDSLYQKLIPWFMNRENLPWDQLMYIDMSVWTHTCLENILCSQIIKVIRKYILIVNIYIYIYIYIYVGVTHREIQIIHMDGAGAGAQWSYQ